jgi:hypothetical protein
MSLTNKSPFKVGKGYCVNDAKYVFPRSPDGFPCCMITEGLRLYCSECGLRMRQRPRRGRTVEEFAESRQKVIAR